MQRTAPGPKRAAAWPRGGLSRGGLVALAVIVVVLLLHPLWLGPLLANRLTQSAGRSVAFDSVRVGLTAELEPVLHGYGVRIANAPWADAPDRPFAVLGEFTAVMSWRGLLQRPSPIRLMVLRDGEVDLERQADGLRNWRLRNPDDRGPGRFQVLALQAERATVRFRHGGIALALQATARPNDAGDAALPTRIDLSGSWRTLPFEASVATGPVLTFLETGTTFPLNGRLRAGGAELALDGRAGDIFRDPLIDAHAVVTGNTLAPFHAFLGARYEHAPRRAFRAEGQLHAADRGVAFTAARAQVGASDFAGDVRVEPAPENGARRMLRANVRSDLLDSADLHWLAGPSAGKPADGPPHPEPPASAADARPAFARRFDAVLGIDARQVRAAEAPWLRSVKLDATLADGRVAIPTFDLGVLQGHATGRLAADLRPIPPSAEVDLGLRGLRIESLLHDASGQPKVTGQLQADAQLRASGDTAGALRASTTGRIHASLGGGTLSSLLDAEIGLQGGKIVKGLLGGSEPIPIRCAAITVDLRQGAGTVGSLVLDTARTRTTGRGSVDLRGETLDLLLTPEAKERSLFVLDRSIHLHGPIRKPQRELVARAEVSPSANAAVCPA